MMPARISLFILFVALMPFATATASSNIVSKNNSLKDKNTEGKKVYDYYCYQCHGYAGDARTLASTYLDPAPRNFSTTSPEQLDQQTMIDAVTNGREGTAMVSFTKVLSKHEIASVVGYIYESFMQNVRQPYAYHTKENGWENHERYINAFPFASGELPLDTPWEQLSEVQRQGKSQFMESCISCHDRAVVNDEGPVWELRPLSYPRKHYDHTAPLDSISGASPYQLHEQAPDTSNLGKQEKDGAALFQMNCAFCHAADASGKNWIGRFMEPHARDLTTIAITKRQDDQLLEIIRNGLQGTSMPAWKYVLKDEQIINIIRYLKRGQSNEQ